MSIPVAPVSPLPCRRCPNTGVVARAARVAAPVLAAWGLATAVAAQPAVRDELAGTAEPVAGAAGPAYWQRSMLWQRRGRMELGLGLAVMHDAQSQGPLAAERGADTSSLGGAPGRLAAMPGAPTMALLAVDRPVTPRVGMRLGMDLPLTRAAGPAGRGLAGAGPDGWADGGLANAPRGELRMGLSFRNRGAYDDVRRGLDLRMDLSGSTALTVRPRGGRVTVQLSSRW